LTNKHPIEHAATKAISADHRADEELHPSQSNLAFSSSSAVPMPLSASIRSNSAKSAVVSGSFMLSQDFPQ
jgi:hypothetical protein